MRRSILGTCVALAALLLAGRTGGAFAQVDAPPPVAAAKKQALYVTISGLNQVFPGNSCTWSANVSNGTPPYTYHWVLSGMVEDYSTGDTWTGYAAHTGQVGLDVLVTDANGQQGWGTLVIYSSTYNYPCW